MRLGVHGSCWDSLIAFPPWTSYKEIGRLWGRSGRSLSVRIEALAPIRPTLLQKVFDGDFTGADAKLWRLATAAAAGTTNVVNIRPSEH
jgi:hypothetical protein